MACGTCKDFGDSDFMSEGSRDEEYLAVEKEIERAKKLLVLRHEFKRQQYPEIKPLYEEERQKLSKKIRPAIYKCLWYIPKVPKYEHHCHHFGNIQLDRSILTQDEHIAYLAQPKKCRCRTLHQKIRCYFVKRYLPNCTPRIDNLAMPRARSIEDTWQHFSHHLSCRQLKSLSKYLMGDMGPDTCNIERAMMLIQEERYQNRIRKQRMRKEAEKIKRCIIEKRKCQIKDIVWGLFEIMKDFLMDVHDVEIKGEMKKLSHIILFNMTKFSDYDYPSEESKEFLDKFLINLATNITIWMEKFTTNFGFAPLFQYDDPDYCEGQYDCHATRDRLPINDYIPPSCSGSTGDEIETEEDDECDDDDNNNNNVCGAMKNT